MHSNKKDCLVFFSCQGQGYSCQSSYPSSSCIKTSVCVGDGTCRSIMRASGTICRPATDKCDRPERWASFHVQEISAKCSTFYFGSKMSLFSQSLQMSLLMLLLFLLTHKFPFWSCLAVHKLSSNVTKNIKAKHPSDVTSSRLIISQIFAQKLTNYGIVEALMRS